MIAVQTWDEEFAFIDGVCKTRELTALAEEVGAHGDDDVQRQIGLRTGFEQ
ncbi:MAG: hypothetical protein QF721_04335 [Verrucomicrobiota bacterium]|nr:hypothetical protein [Verrucomicrobiota bacterium]